MDDNKVDIEIIRVDNPWRFLAREKPECARSPQAQAFQEVYREMNVYCQRLTDAGMACYKPSVGEICAASSREDDLWHRVKVEGINPQSHGKQMCCYMIDRGIQLTVPLSRLVKLSKCFQQIPPQVLHCRLWGIQPLSLQIVQTDTGVIVVDRPSNKWDPAAIDYMQKMVDESERCQAEILHRDSDNTLHMRLFFTTRKGTVCFNEVLLYENYATQSEADLKYGSLLNSSNYILNNSSTSLTSDIATDWSKPINMPDLISHESHKQSLPEITNSGDCKRPCQTKGCALDKQEIAACLNLNTDCSFSVTSKSESRMNVTTQSQPAVLTLDTDLSLTVKTSRSDYQQSVEDSCQGSDHNSRMQPFIHQTNPLISSKLFKLSTEASQNIISFGRGRGFYLPQNGNLISPGTLQKEQHRSFVSTNVQTRPDADEMPPLIPDIHRTASDHGLPPRTSDEHPLHDSPALKSPVAMNQQQQKLHRASSPRISSASSTPRDGCRVQNSESPDMNREMESEVVDVHIVPQKPNIPLLTRQDKPMPRPIFGVVVHGKGVPSPICDVCDVPFKESVKTALDELDIDSARSIQAFVWPAVLSCRHIVGICPPGLGKTMSYVPAVVSLLLAKLTYIELPPGKGPIAVVIVPSWKNARDVYEMVESLNSPANSTQKIKSYILYAGGTEDSERSQISLLQGCDILIATPHSLIRMLDQDITSLKRMCHIILDDADVLANRFRKEVEIVMQRYMLHLKDRKVQHKCQDLPKQVMMFANCWTKGVEDFYLRYTKEAIIAISSRVEASVYGGVRQVVKLTKEEQRLSTLCNLLGSLATTKHRVAVFTQMVEEADQLYQAAKSRSVYCLLVHENLPAQVIEDTRTEWLRSSHSRQMMVMVCTDQCYQDLVITNATMVVHYGLPDSKTKFGNRLACMLDYFVDRTSATKCEIEPVSQVILTEKYPERTQDFYEILQRCPAEYSTKLQQYLTGYRMVSENSERKVLCPFLKSFGVCNVQNRCKYRHLMIPGRDLKTGDTTLSTLPSSGEVKIKVIYVENASRYYCHLLEHRSVPGNVRTDLRLQYQRLVMQMVSLFSKESNQVPYIPSEDPFLDGVCAYKDSDGIYYRAQVLEVSKKSSTAAAKYHLWLVDAGHHKTATIDQLLKLPQSLAQVPYQAVEVFLCCVKPMDDDVEWTIEANMFINDLIQGKELVGRIMLSVGLTVWLLPLVHQVSLKSVGLTSDINVRQELLENKFAAANADHMQSLFELFRGKIEISEKLMRQYFDYTLKMEMRQESLTENEGFHEVSIAVVISPDLFYVHKWENFELLEALEARIAEVVKQQTETSERDQQKADVDMQLEIDSVCLALSADNRWYRAQIVAELISGKWLVFFLDYGDKEKICKSNVRPLPRQLAELPCQAMECQLAYIQPSGSKWDRLATDVICDLAYFANEDKKKLFAKVVSKVDACYGIGQKLVIDLFDRDVSFSQQVVWRCKVKDIGDNAAIKDLIGKPALRKQLFFNSWDKIPYLCANIYWAEVHSEAVEQASELQEILSCRDKGWDSGLLQRQTLSSAFKVAGYIQDSEAHGVLVDSLVTCCLDSDRVADFAVSEDFLSSLAACLEQASRPSVQHQAARAVAKLVNHQSFLKSLTNCSHLMSVLTQFLCRPPGSSIELETLKCLCSAASKIVYRTDESSCAELKNSEMVEQIFSSLKQTSVDVERAPWLEMLAAIATWDSCHGCLMREAHVAGIMNLLVQCSCEKCLYYLMSVCRCLVTSSRKHKVVLLENKLMIILKDLESGGLSSPTIEICLQLMEELSLTLPQPESLAGVRAYQPTEVCKTVSPSVTWSQNCFRVVLTVQVTAASVEDFSVSDSRISCRSESDRVMSHFDWELYDSVVPERSKVCVYASYSLVSLRKQTTGKWSRLLKQKVKLPNLRPDFEHPYNSDEEEDVDDEVNLTRLTQKKYLLRQEEMLKVKTLKTFESSEDSSDEQAFPSHSSDEDPAIDMGSIIGNAARNISHM